MPSNDKAALQARVMLPCLLGFVGQIVSPAAWAQSLLPPINTKGDYLGEKLNTANFILPGFMARFDSVPSLRTGSVTASAPVALTDPSFQWRAAYIHATPEQGAPPYIPPGDPDPAFSWFSDELAVYPNADAIAAAGSSPFSQGKAGSLSTMKVTATTTSAAYLAMLPSGFATNYISGAINSYPFSQEYGYFEMRAKLPDGAGLWPAFWLLPEDDSWPPEIDAMEVLGGDPTVLYTTIHTVINDPGPTKTHYAYATHIVDLSKAFHNYGVDWGPEKIRFFLDRKLVFSYPTPSDCHKPFYLIANLAVGGPSAWGGAPTSKTVFPASMAVEYIAVWQRSSYLAALQ